MKCDHCGKPIRKKADLIVAMHSEHRWLAVHHVWCHERAIEKQLFYHIIDVPVNTASGSARIILLAALFLMASLPLYAGWYEYGSGELLMFSSILIILSIALLFVRLYSYLKFERKLK